MTVETALTEDSLLDGRIRLRQPAAGYRAAIDPVLLAAAAPAASGDLVADLGCGVASASLCLLQRVPEVRVMGLELQADLAALAQQNARLNGVEDRLSIVSGDVAAPPAGLAAGSFDQVMMNPPYLDPSATRPVEDKARRIATVEGEAGLAVWMDCALTLLRPRACLTLIHRCERLDEILAYLSPDWGQVSVFPLWPHAGQAAKRVIVQARKGTGAGLRLLPGLVLHDADGAYTEATDAVLRAPGTLAL
ncbi:tRNA1(Val) (adenine(37)-N6)-methyltransferase [Pelagibius sp.]|uniref:tRNA1(Val) (adenine(37)-N6)-methyltransferase n=1 Tax=Pelagibius sp. TaxID=1931238 RepID=UPI002608C201|nr:methyltransferase [Pelagibius sp.]